QRQEDQPQHQLQRQQHDPEDQVQDGADYGDRNERHDGDDDQGRQLDHVGPPREPSRRPLTRTYAYLVAKFLSPCRLGRAPLRSWSGGCTGSRRSALLPWRLVPACDDRRTAFPDRGAAARRGEAAWRAAPRRRQKETGW